MSRTASHRKPRTKQGLALAGVATLTALSCAGVVDSAAADPGHNAASASGKSHGQHRGTTESQASAAPRGKAKGHGKAAGHGQTKGSGHGTVQGQTIGQGTSTDDSNHNPPGNNGTVKITAPSDPVGQPSNDPQPGCTVEVEWFGYDAGADVDSTVTFTPQAPTSDVTISGTEPSTVFVGGDEAGGGTDLDGHEAYTLTFAGAPQPQQGYHVKLTVATPYSLGSDTKTKVFWIAPCTDATAGTTAADTADATAPDATAPDATDAAPETTTEGQVLGTYLAAREPAPMVAGVHASVRPADAPVPTAVDAGESPLPDWARTPLPLALIGGGALLTAAAVVRRSRSRA